MKIIRLNTDFTDGKSYVTVTAEVAAALPEAVSSVLALFTNEHHVMTPSQGEASGKIAIGLHAMADDASSLGVTSATSAPQSAAQVTRTRRPRNNPDAGAIATKVTDAAEATADAAHPLVEALPSGAADVPAEPATTGTRRRRNTEPAAAQPEVKVITDADLAKAASNAAAIITPDVVKAVLADFGVSEVSEIAPDQREKFLGELDEEIRLAKEEAAAAKAG